MDLKIVAVTLLLVLFCSEVYSYHHHRKREAQEKVPLEQAEEAAQSYWDQLSGTTQGWVDQISSIEWKEKARELYEKSKNSINFYTGVFVDQAYHWWHS